jgi:hypothetical protein
MDLKREDARALMKKEAEHESRSELSVNRDLEMWMPSEDPEYDTAEPSAMFTSRFHALLLHLFMELESLSSPH